MFNPTLPLRMKAILLTLLALGSALNLRADLVTKPVSYELNGTKLTGYLAYDDSVTAKGKVPGILVFHEWWGLNDYIKGRANQLAKMGYVAFAPDMYGDGESTTDPAKAKELSSQLDGKPLMAERAQAGLDQLLKQASLMKPESLQSVFVLAEQPRWHLPTPERLWLES